MRVSRPVRPRTREFSRDEILETARSLFVQEGYDAVSVRKIAAKTGCSPGTIYLHFKDKAEIFEKLCAETFSKLSARLQAIASDDDEPLECLRRGGRAYVAFALEHPSHYLVTFVMGNKTSAMNELAERNPNISDAGAQCFSNLKAMVDRCIDAGVLRVNNVDEVSQVLWTSLHGLSSLLITHCGFPFVERSRLIERHLDILIHGIQHPKLT